MKNAESETEKHLILRSRQGDADAFGELTRRYRKKILGLCIHIMRDQELAEDIVQEVFIHAYQRISHFKMQSRFYTWLYRIAINLSINAMRRRSRQRNVALTQDAAENINALKSTTESPTLLDVEQHELHDAIEQAMTELTKPQRDVLRLYDLEGMSYDAIAKRLRIKPGTVRSRLYYARRKMRSVLSEKFIA